MGVWLGQGGWYVRRGLGWAGEWEVAGLSLHSSVLALPIPVLGLLGNLSLVERKES